MGAFRFLKWFSPKKEKQEVKEKTISEIDSWINSQSKKRFEDINKKLLHLKECLNEEKAVIKENITILENAQLTNPNLPEKAHLLMQGNRKTYMQKLHIFLDKMVLPDRFSSQQDILDVLYSLNQALDQFEKSGSRSYYVLKDLLGNQVTPCFETVQKIDKIIKQLEQIVENARLEKMNSLMNVVDLAQKKTKRKQEIIKKIKQAKNELENQYNQIKEKENKVKKCEQGLEYKKVMELLNKKSQIEQKIKIIEEQQLQSFSVINTSFKKYERMTVDDQLVRTYLNNWLSALIEDQELKIVNVVTKMKEALITGKIELKKKKKDKVLVELHKLNRNHFETFLMRYKAFNQQKDDLQLEIEKAEIIKTLEKEKTDLKKSMIKVKEDKQMIVAMNKELEGIHIEELRQNIEKEIFGCMGETVKIVNREKFLN